MNNVITDIKDIKRCMACEHTICEQIDDKYIYKCTLSKNKCKNCLREIEDYFKAV